MRSPDITGACTRAGSPQAAPSDHFIQIVETAGAPAQASAGAKLPRPAPLPLAPPPLLPGSKACLADGALDCVHSSSLQVCTYGCKQ